MSHTPLKKYGKNYAETIMDYFNPNSSPSEIKDIQDWRENHKSTCTTVPLPSYYPNLTRNQRWRINKYARQFAKELQKAIDCKYPHWYPFVEYNPKTEEVDYDPYD